MRTLHSLRALKDVGDVTFMAIGSNANDAEAMRETAAEFDIEPPVEPVTFPNRGLGDKLRWAFDSRYLNLHGYIASAADQDRVRATAARFDLVWIVNSRTPNILQQWHWPHAHLDLDDVPSTYLRAVAQNEGSGLKRWKAILQQRLLLRRERLFTERFTTLSVCSEEDRRYLGNDETTHVIPNGFERPPSTPVHNPAGHPPRIGFIGLFSYAPNLDGVQWFLKECWPEILREVPGARFRLVGRDTDGPLKPAVENVDALGWQADPASEIATWSLMVIPIRFGGGTRVKLVDAFSRKCPVVSTGLGAFGYDVHDGRQLRLADRPGDFARACIDLVRDRAQAEALAEQAWRDFLEKWTWDAISPKIQSAAEDCLRRSRRQPAGAAPVGTR